MYHVNNFSLSSRLSHEMTPFYDAFFCAKGLDPSAVRLVFNHHPLNVFLYISHLECKLKALTQCCFSACALSTYLEQQ